MHYEREIVDERPKPFVLYERSLLTPKCGEHEMSFKPFSQLLVGAIPRRRPSDLVAGTGGVRKVEKMKSASVDSGAATEWVHIDDANVGVQRMLPGRSLPPGVSEDNAFLVSEETLRFFTTSELRLCHEIAQRGEGEGNTIETALKQITENCRRCEWTIFGTVGFLQSCGNCRHGAPPTTRTQGSGRHHTWRSLASNCVAAEMQESEPNPRTIAWRPDYLSRPEANP